MRVLQIGKFYPLSIGGLEQLIHSIYSGLNAMGVDCDVLSYSKTLRSSTERTSLGTIYRSASVGCIRSTWLSPWLPWHLRRLHADYDIIHLHHPDPMAALAFFMVRPRAKLVVHWHADIVRQKIAAFFIAPLLRWLLRRADAIIVTTPNYKRSHHLRPWRAKVSVIPAGIDSSRWRADNRAAAAIRAAYPGRFIVLAVGRLIYYKGFEYLVRAAARVNDKVVVLIIGEGGERAKLERLIEEMQLQDKVKLLGYKDNRELANYYQACDLFCLSSVASSEAFGIVQLEAMCFGKAIVSTRIPQSGVSWVNANYISGINVKVKDAAALANAITMLQQHPNLRARLGRRGKQRRGDMFSREKMCRQLKQLYAAL